MFRALLPAIVLALLVVPRAADACSCVFSSPCRIYASADAVFAGDVLEVTQGPPDGPPRPKLVRLRVARAFKGTASVGQEVIVEMPGGSSASCSLDITPGSRVVIFGSVQAGRFSTSLCQGSYPLRAEAPWPMLPPPGGVVSGRLERYRPSGADTPLPNVGVWITTPDGRIAAKTDAAGAFRLTGVPAGKWTVEFALGPTERADSKIELMSGDDCAEVYAEPQPRGQ